jgi:hypothetical protein
MSYGSLRYFEDGRPHLYYISTESMKYISDASPFVLLRKLITRIGNAFAFLSG